MSESVTYSPWRRMRFLPWSKWEDGLYLLFYIHFITKTLWSVLRYFLSLETLCPLFTSFGTLTGSTELSQRSCTMSLPWTLFRVARGTPLLRHSHPFDSIDLKCPVMVSLLSTSLFIGSLTWPHKSSHD